MRSLLMLSRATGVGPLALPPTLLSMALLVLLTSAATAQLAGLPVSDEAEEAEPEAVEAAVESGQQERADDSSQGVRLGESQTQQLRVGMVITASPGSPCQGILATVPVPADWPEQKVSIVQEDVSPTVRRLTYRTLDDGVKQMVIQIPLLPAGQSARALVTFEVQRYEILAPADPSPFEAPQRMTRQLRAFLGESPYIETRNRKVRSIADQLRSENKDRPVWEQVEAIYDYVRENIEYREGQIKGAVAALEDETGDCEELTSLFVALCRLHRIPARCVWVTDHCYPEFYLVDERGQGHWIPCQAAGSRAFGSMPERRPILQKGDNIFVPEKRARERYVAEFLKVQSLRGNAPQVQFVREFVNSDAQ